MSEEAVAEELEDELDEPGPQKKFSGKKIVLFIGLPVLLLLAGGVVMMSAMSGSGESAQESAASAARADDAVHAAANADMVFYDLPTIVVNLSSTSRRPSFLKISVSLELSDEEDIEKIDALTRRIVDQFQVYLRELRIDDLRGSAGIYRLREELLARVNDTVRPTKVHNVLFKEVLVQ